jgi:hypothetical protein
MESPFPGSGGQENAKPGIKKISKASGLKVGTRLGLTERDADVYGSGVLCGRPPRNGES